jgi:hypothetical protein
MEYIRQKTKIGEMAVFVNYLEKVNFDLTFHGRAILGGSKLRFKFVPNPVKFFLMFSDEKITPKVEFVELALNIVRAKVNPDIVIAYQKALTIAPARYPMTRSDVRTTTINTTLENVINGQSPRRCFISFVSNEAFNGSLKKNPYYFHHYDLNYFAVYLNGDQYPRRAFQPDFRNGHYLREFLELYGAANQMLTDCHMTISRNNYAKGSKILGFNFSPDLSDGCGMNGYVSQSKTGTRLELHFSKPLPETINVLIYSEFDNLLMIPEDRNAIIDYH